MSFRNSHPTKVYIHTKEGTNSTRSEEEYIDKSQTSDIVIRTSSYQHLIGFCEEFHRFSKIIQPIIEFFDLIQRVIERFTTYFINQGNILF